MTVIMSIALLLLRLGIGLTLAGHGVQKLFGWFGGPGLQRVKLGFEKQGFRHLRCHGYGNVQESLEKRLLAEQRWL